jgi:hypothetical protein
MAAQRGHDLSSIEGIRGAGLSNGLSEYKDSTMVGHAQKQCQESDPMNFSDCESLQASWIRGCKKRIPVLQILVAEFTNQCSQLHDGAFSLAFH